MYKFWTYPLDKSYFISFGIENKEDEKIESLHLLRKGNLLVGTCDNGDSSYLNCNRRGDQRDKKEGKTKDCNYWLYQEKRLLRGNGKWHIGQIEADEHVQMFTRSDHRF